MPDHETLIEIPEDGRRARGLLLRQHLQEYVPGSQGAFIEMTEELKRIEARHVIVPSLSHLSTHPILRAAPHVRGLIFGRAPGPGGVPRRAGGARGSRAGLDIHSVSRWTVGPPVMHDSKRPPQRV